METAVAEIGVQKYEEYKESGVEWIGEMPAHWEVVRSKALFQERKEKAREDDKQLTASQKYGMIGQEEFMEKEGRRVTVVVLDRSILKHIEANDFIISMRSFQGGLEYSTQSGCVSSAYIPLIPIKHVVPTYFKYLFKSDGYIQSLSSTSNLVRDGQAMRFENFAAVPLLIVPEEEQTAIADFLDCRTAQIDQAIAQKERLIELLQERRQILIQRAVTRGLNPDAPMKDSGVEWIGEIPAHWEVKKLKFVVQILKRIANATGLDVLSITQRGIKVKDIESGEGQIALDYSKYQLLFRGEFAMNHMDLLTGYVDISNFNGVVSPDYRVFNLVNLKFDKFYLLKVFQLCYKCKVFYAFGQGVSQLGRWRFPAENFNDFIIPEPPHNEQQEISRTIDRLELALKKPVDLAELQIKKLREYKSTLINAAVTGKIKVC